MILGCAMPEAEQGLNVARIASLRAACRSRVGGHRQPVLLVGPAGDRATPPSASCAARADAILAGGTESMSLVPMGGHKVAPNPTLVERYPDVYLTTGLVAENHAREVRHLARGAGRVRAAEPSARDRGDRRRPIRRRDRPGAGRARSTDGNGADPRSVGTSFSVDEGPRRDTSPEALAQAAAGVSRATER